jgi:hypothetical protein
LKLEKDNNATHNLKVKHQLLEFVKTAPFKGKPLKRQFEGFSVIYDGYWTRYKITDAPIRCHFPEEISETLKLPECARNCWKLLMFRRKREDVQSSVDKLIPMLKKREIVSFKHNGDCHEADLNTGSFVIVIYTWGTRDRDRLKAKLHSAGFVNIPYRRGCKMFEIRFGHWKNWFKEE